MNEKILTVVEHLDELRSRIIKSLAVLICTSVVVYFFVPAFIPFLTRPVGKLVFNHPSEAFTGYVNIAIFFGIILSSPFIIYQIWKFISSAVTQAERKNIVIFGITSFLLFILGASLGFFVIVPLGVKFLLSFATDSIIPMITFGKYVSFVAWLTCAFGFVFQLPLVILFLAGSGMITPELLARRRREVIVLIFILSAILTPTVDIITQIVFALPLLFLYEASIMLAKAKRKKFKIC